MKRWAYVDIGDVVLADENGSPTNHDNNLVCELADPDDEATGELIAAAPELKEGLRKAFIFICQNCPLGPTYGRTPAGELIDSLRVLLASVSPENEEPADS